MHLISTCQIYLDAQRSANVEKYRKIFLHIHYKQQAKLSTGKYMLANFTFSEYFAVYIYTKLAIRIKLIVE